MKEKFQDRSLTGSIKTTCKFDDGTQRVWNAEKAEVIEHIIEIVEDYESQGYKLTLRQLHYQLVTRNWIINHDSAYKKLGSILDDCKYAGLVDWENIEDRGRIPFIPYSVADVPDALQDAVDTYRIDRQRGQDNVVELWTEKDALSGILKRTTSKYHVQLVVNKGYTSSSAIYRAYERCQQAIDEDKTFTILYFGDHDPSGLDMVRDIRERMEFMLQNGDNSYEWEDEEEMERFKVIPIGLTMQQIKQYNLPPNPTKLTDSRANAYIKKFGKTCWEVDALRPNVLTSLVEENIREQIDMDKYHEIVAQEKKEKETIQAIIKKLNK